MNIHEFLFGKNVAMTRTQSEFLEMMIESIEKNPHFKKNMESPGDRRNIFQLVQQYYRAEKHD